MPSAYREYLRAYKAEKEAQYAKYQELLDEALRAGAAAAAAVPQAERRMRGAVWVRLADGRSKFACFAREQHGGTWRHGTRSRGTHLPASFAFLEQGRAWAREVARVLCEGDVQASWGSRAVCEPAGGPEDGDSGADNG